MADELEGVNGGLWDTCVPERCCNGTSGFLYVEQQYLWHPVTGSEGSLLAEESHKQSSHSSTGREVWLALSTFLRDTAHPAHLPWGANLVSTFYREYLLRIKKPKPIQREAGLALVRGVSLVGTASWILADAYELTEGTNWWYGKGLVHQMCSLVKTLPIVQHI